MKALFRVVLPGDGVAVGFLCLYAACYLPHGIYYLYGGRGELAAALGIKSAVQSLHPIVIILTTLVYAGFRVYAFHPAFRKDYRDWLKQTPWRWGLPLPLGPVHLVPQDLVILTILSGFAWRHLGEFWWLVPCVFLGMHSLCMLSSFLRTGLNRHAYVLAFGLGGVLWLFDDPLRLKLLLLAIYGVAFHGLRRSLKLFEDWDWERLDQWICVGSEAQALKSRRLGWPFDSLGPHREPFPISLGWAAALAVLAGWWVLGLASNFDNSDTRNMTFILVVFGGLFASVGRLIKYLWGYAPPISFRGRIATGQWIIPGYDRIFVAPLVTLAIVASLKWLVLDLHVPTELALSVVTTAYVFVTFGWPPTLDEWRLTGNHRIVPAVSKPEMQQIP